MDACRKALDANLLLAKHLASYTPSNCKFAARDLNLSPLAVAWPLLNGGVESGRGHENPSIPYRC